MIKKSLSTILFLLTIVLFVNCNNNEDDDITSSNDVNNDDYLWFFSGKIDGEPFIYGQKDGETTRTYGLTTSLSQLACFEGESSGFTFAPGIYPDFDSSLPTMDIEFNRMYNCSSDLSIYDSFNNLFPVKEYDFVNNNDIGDQIAGKVGLYYSSSASTDTYYSTYSEDTSVNFDISGNFFEITSSSVYNTYFFDEIYSYGQAIEGDFSATFYNTQDSSDIVEITDGKFKLYVEY